MPDPDNLKEPSSVSDVADQKAFTFQAIGGLRPAFHLACEEWLLQRPPEGTSYLLCYFNDPCVVIGKNQNPWLECDLKFMAENRIALARRCSGGGTVYHDRGNLNFSYIMPRADFDHDESMILPLEGLRYLGLKAERGDGHAITIDGRKCSGSAFAYKRYWAMHHWTVLLNADLEQMSRCLKPDVDGIESRAVRSKPASVVNISDVAPGFRDVDVIDAMFEAVKHFGNVNNQIDDSIVFDKNPEVQALVTKHVRDDWVYGRTPEFTVNVPRPESGLIDLIAPPAGIKSVKVKDGIVKTITFWDDGESYLSERKRQEILDAWLGEWFHRSLIQ